MSDIIKNVYIPAIEAYYPSGLKEMQDIADGAEVSLESVVLLNARYVLQGWETTVRTSLLWSRQTGLPLFRMI